MLKSGDIDGSIDFLENYADQEDETEMLHEVISLSRRYNSLERDIRKGTISKDDKKLEMNQIVAGLLGLAETLNT